MIQKDYLGHSFFKELIIFAEWSMAAEVKTSIAVVFEAFQNNGLEPSSWFPVRSVNPAFF